MWMLRCYLFWSFRTGDISSISGSDDSSDSSSETDDVRPKPSPLPARVHKSTQDSTDSDSEGASAVLAATRKHPKLFLRNSDGQLVSLYRCLLPTFNEVKRVHQMLTSVECYGDESTVVDFVPVSPPRHISRDSGQLEIRPDTVEKRSPQRRKDKGQAFADTKTAAFSFLKQKLAMRQLTKAGNAAVENTAADVEEKEQSDVEVELVEQVVEVYTEELSEFGHSIPKQNKKKKKRKNQTVKEVVTDRPSQANVQEYDETEVELKNKLYTACRCELAGFHYMYNYEAAQVKQ
nr:hypothetical protein BaRGS_007080 [Batillaria attramentaria]